MSVYLYFHTFIAVKFEALSSTLKHNKEYSTATSCLLHSPLPVYHTLWNEYGREPPPKPISLHEGGETLRSLCRFRLMAYMWFSNQAERKHACVCLLSIKYSAVIHLLFLWKGIWLLFDTLLHLLPFPFSYVNAVFLRMMYECSCMWSRAFLSQSILFRKWDGVIYIHYFIEDCKAV